MQIDGFKSGTIKGKGHFILTIDALLAQDGHARAGAGSDREGCFGVEGGFDDQTLVWFEECIVFLLCAVRVVAPRLHTVGQFGPCAVKRGDGLTVDRLPVL